MKTAIFGFAGTGKTELFLALAGPGPAGRDQAMVKVPEPRLQPLTDLYNPKKVTQSEIEYLEIPGGGAQGEGLGSRVLNAIRAHDCFLAVLDAFSGAHSPEEQWQAIETDFIVADLDVAEKRLEKMETDSKKSKNLVDPAEQKLLQQAKEHLEEETPLRQVPELAEAPELRGFCFLSAKPVLYAWNVSEEGLKSLEMPKDGKGVAHIPIAAKMEREMAELEDPEEQQMFMQDLGVEKSALDRVIASTYSLLGLITFLTAGEKEVRAWPLRNGSTAPEAAGVIHSDLEKGFIRAEVLAWSDFEEVKTFKAAKEKGLLRLEGKNYVVRDGDIITFRFNV